jgi:hypothetical protein
MTRLQRTLSAGIAFAVAVGTILLLTLTGSRSEGPIARVFSGVAAAVQAAEIRAVRNIRGEGRRQDLAWLDPYRSVENLRLPDRVLLGAYDDGLPWTLEGIYAIEQAIGTTLPLVQFYTAWGDQPEQQFPGRVARAISDLGSIPVITWEPWLSVFSEKLHPELGPAAVRDQGGLAAIARGEYDFYIDSWAADAAAFGGPLFVRFAHEMNDAYRYPWGPHQNDRDDYIAAWRHVVGRFRQGGATNVIWVWSPHVAYDGWEWYYPGADVVDWVATNVLNYANVAYWSRWWSFDEIFGSRYETLASFAKPVMIAELGTLAVGGDPAEWFRQALADLPQRYPAVKGVLFFHDAADQTVTQQELDWGFTRAPELTGAIHEALEGWAEGGL